MANTIKQYEDAARVVHQALTQRASTKGRRLHADNYKRQAAEALGLRAVYPARWAAVLDAGKRLGLFQVELVGVRRYPVLVAIVGQPTAHSLEPVENTVESLEDEDTTDDPTVENSAARSFGVLVSFPPGHRSHHRGFHLFLDAWVHWSQLDQALALCKRQGAKAIQVIQRSALGYTVPNSATAEAK